MALGFKNNSHGHGYHVNHSPIDVNHFTERHALDSLPFLALVIDMMVVQVLSGDKFTFIPDLLSVSVI